MGNSCTTYNRQAIVADSQLIRVEGEKLEQLLHRSVGALTFLDNNGQIGYSSAALISKDIIITAASNIFNRQYKQHNKDFKFYIGVDGMAEEQIQIEGWRYPYQFRNCWEEEKLQFDFAVIKLNTRVELYEYLPLYLPCPSCVWRKQLTMFGFPCSYGNYTALDETGNRKRLYQYGISRIGKVVEVDESNFKIGHKVSAMPGQIGSPITMDDAIISIHVGGDGYLNISRIIDSYAISKIEEWINQLDASPAIIEQQRQCPHLLDLCFRNLNTVDLSDYSNLLKVNLSNNNILTIDLTHCPCITQLLLSFNQLSALDLNSNILLTRLDARSNRIEHINVNSCTKLVYLQLWTNKIKKIDLRNNIKLTELYIGTNKLEFIDVSHNKQLVFFSIGQNSLATIDIRNNTQLRFFWINSNKLQRIDFSCNKLLQNIWLQSNRLQEVDLSNNYCLRWIYIQNNRLRLLSGLTISENVRIDSYKIKLADQKSQKCRVQLRCANEALKVKCNEIACEWRQKYQQKCQNRYRCKYEIVVL